MEPKQPPNPGPSPRRVVWGALLMGSGIAILVSSEMETQQLLSLVGVISLLAGLWIIVVLEDVTAVYRSRPKSPNAKSERPPGVGAVVF